MVSATQRLREQRALRRVKPVKRAPAKLTRLKKEKADLTKEKLKEKAQYEKELKEYNADKQAYKQAVGMFKQGISSAWLTMSKESRKKYSKTIKYLRKFEKQSQTYRRAPTTAPQAPGTYDPKTGSYISPEGVGMSMIPGYEPPAGTKIVGAPEISAPKLPSFLEPKFETPAQEKFYEEIIQPKVEQQRVEVPTEFKDVVQQPKDLDIGGIGRVSAERYYRDIDVLPKDGRKEQPRINITGTTGTLVSAYPAGAGGTALWFPLTQEQIKEQEKLTERQQKVFGVETKPESALLISQLKLKAQQKQAEKVEEIKKEINKLSSKLEKEGKINTITNSFTDKATKTDIDKYNRLYTNLERAEAKVTDRELYVGLGKYGEKKDILGVETGVSLLSQTVGEIGGEFLKPLGKEEGIISYTKPKKEVKIFEPQFGTQILDPLTLKPIKKFKDVTIPERKVKIGTPEQFETIGGVGATVGLYSIPVIGTGLFTYEVAKDFKSADFNPVKFVRENPVEAIALATLGTIKATSKIKSTILTKRVNELQKQKWSFTGTKITVEGDKTLLRISASKLTKRASAEAELFLPIRQLKNGRFVVETGKGAVYIRAQEPSLFGDQLFTKVQTFTTAGKGVSKRAFIKTPLGNVLIDDINLFISSGTGYVVPTGAKGFTPFRFGTVGVKEDVTTKLIGGDISKLRVYPSKFIGETKVTGLFKVSQKGEMREFQKQFSSTILGKKVGKKTPWEKTHVEEFKKGIIKIEKVDKGMVQVQKSTKELDKLTEGFTAKALKTAEKVALKELPKITTKFDVKLIAGLETKQKQFDGFLLGDVSKVKQIQEKELVTKERLGVGMALDNLTKTIDLEGYSQKIAQDIKQVEVVKQKPRAIISVLTTPTIIKPPKIKPKKFKFAIRSKKERDIFFKEEKQAYDVYIPEIKTGKKIKVTKNPVMGRRRAEDVGQNITDRTLARTFILKESKKQPKPLDFKIPPNYSRFYGFKFRGYKLRKGRKIPLKNKFIEQKKYI